MTLNKNKAQIEKEYDKMIKFREKSFRTSPRNRLDPVVFEPPSLRYRLKNTKPKKIATEEMKEVHANE